MCFFISPGQSFASNQTIIITEIGAYEKSSEEWVEIYNAGSAPVDLTGWVFWENSINHRLKLAQGADIIVGPGEYALIVQDDTAFLAAYPSVTTTIIDSSWGSLKESGEEVGLKNAAGEFIEQFTYIAARTFSLERIDYSLADYSSNNWTEHEDSNTVGRVNSRNSTSVSTPVENTTSTPQQETSEPEILQRQASRVYQTGDLRINEFVSDPADDNVEFVELQNMTSGIIDLGGWWIEEGSSAKTFLSGSVISGGYTVVEKPKGNLNNSGDRIFLFDPNEHVIDDVTYGEWDDGNTEDNAPVASDPKSVARNDGGTFEITEFVTKGEENKFVVQKEKKKERKSSSEFFSGKIFINEVLPNPAGSDGEKEYIELFNAGDTAVNLQGWKLGDATNKRFSIKNILLRAGAYKAFERSMTGIALNNAGGETIVLEDSSGNQVDLVRYTGKALEDHVYARTESGAWNWSAVKTKGKENIVEMPNEEPTAAIDVEQEVAVGEGVVFDASDSSDPDGDPLSFLWAFGDGFSGEGSLAEHVYGAPGVYDVLLSVSDGQSTSTKKEVITVKNAEDFVGGNDGEIDGAQFIRVSEFIPNPTGSDATEFIELFHAGSDSVDLSGFKLDDEDGGSRGYTLPDKTVLEPGAYLVFGKQETKIALNNTSDSVRLLYPDGSVVTEIAYDDVVEGASFVQDDNDKWIWTSELTPGEKNIVQAIKQENRKIKKGTARSRRLKPIVHTPLSEIRKYDIGDRVRVSGIVAVLPGVFGVQYFYIVTDGGGIQVYSHKKDFPKLKVGQQVEVSGELSEAYGEMRLKIASKKDIRLVQKETQQIIPAATDIATVGEAHEGQLLKIAGEITELKASNMYVDDGTEEIKVYFKKGAGISKKMYKVGNFVEVAGLVSERRGVYQMLPRSSEDITITGAVDLEEDSLVMSSSTDPSADVAETYLTATAGGLTSILIGLFARARGAAALGFAKRAGSVAVSVVRRRWWG